MSKKNLMGGTESDGLEKTAKTVIPLNAEQKQVLRVIHDNTITFLSGPAGTGKTWLAVAYGVSEFLKGRYERLIFTRPCIEANGEKLGYLPGSANDKIGPYMLPIFDILSRRMTKKDIDKLINEGKIVTLPMAFQRGITFTNAYVVGDEFQNACPSQVRMFLTRIGENSKIVVTGDITQSDIEGRCINGLADAIGRMQGADGIGIASLSTESIVRHPIIKVIEERYALPAS